MPTLTIIRGLPGSGKSTLAKKIGAHHFEADMFFERDGHYHYNPAYIKDAHQWCQDCVSCTMSSGDDIVVSNTFVRLWEMDPYLTLAKTHGYEVHVIECKGRWESVHGVPAHKIAEMRLRWENLI